MATKFLEAGGDADFSAQAGTTGLWAGNLGTVVSDIVHGFHLRSLKAAAGGLQIFTAISGILGDTGNRINFFVYFVALPSGAKAAFFRVQNSSSNSVFRLYLTSAGILQLWDAAGASQLGSDGPTLVTGRWYRISVAFITTSTSVNEFRVFVNGTSAISVTNATLTRVGSFTFAIGNQDTDAALDSRYSDVYADDSNTLLDPGNIWVTAKRPFANGSLNEFTTQIGAGNSGYGSGHADEVNERANSDTNGWSISTTTRKTEEYSIEGLSAGDKDLTGATILDFMGWIRAKVDSTSNSPVHRIIVAGTTTAITMTTSAKAFVKIAGSTTYPAGNTDIGMDAQYTTTPHLTSLFECGIQVAYIPPDYPITAAQGSYTLTGKDSLFSVGHKVIAALGSYALTGKNALFSLGRGIVAGVGNFVLTGQTALITSTRKIVAALGSYTLTGQSILFSVGKKIVATVGIYVLTGQSALVNAARKITAVFGSYTLTGQNSLFSKSLKIVASVGSYVLSGQPIRYLLNGLLAIYSNKYTRRNTSYSDKLSSRGTNYSNKYSSRGSSYSDKYTHLP